MTTTRRPAASFDFRAALRADEAQALAYAEAHFASLSPEDREEYGRAAVRRSVREQKAAQRAIPRVSRATTLDERRLARRAAGAFGAAKVVVVAGLARPALDVASGFVLVGAAWLDRQARG